MEDNASCKHDAIRSMPFVMTICHPYMGENWKIFMDYIDAYACIWTNGVNRKLKNFHLNGEVTM